VSNFLGSESGQKLGVKVLQFMLPNTPDTPHLPQSFTVYIYLFTW
jgi:hypothetical protein